MKKSAAAAAAQKMAEMKNPIADYREPSGGGWMNEQKPKAAAEAPARTWVHSLYGLTKTETRTKKQPLTTFFFLSNPVPFRISVKIKIENKNLCYSPIFYYNISQIPHLYKHL